MKATLKKKARIILMFGSFLLAAVLALTGVLIYFKLNKTEKKPLDVNPGEIFNPLDFSVDAWDGLTVSASQFNQNFASRGSNTFTIDSASSFVYFVDRVNSGSESFEGKKVFLNRNIDLQGFKLDSIGTEDHPFKGSFDGGFYTIFNANINGDGLFGCVENAEIKNLGLYNSNIDSENEIAGGLIGKAVNTNVESCYVRKNSINGINVGGLVGEFISNDGKSHQIINSFVDTLINAQNLGGLVYKANSNNSSENEIVISQSYFTQGSAAVAVKDDFVDTTDRVVDATKVSNFRKDGWEYHSNYLAGKAWCDYEYRANSQQLDFNFPIQSGFVKVFLTGSHYEGVVLVDGEPFDVSNISKAFAELNNPSSVMKLGSGSGKTEAEINILVDKVFMEARAEVSNNVEVSVKAVKDSTIVRDEKNLDSLFVATGDAKIVLGSEIESNPIAPMSSNSSLQQPKLIIDGNRNFIEENGLKSNALVVSNGGELDINENVVLKNNINNADGHGGAVLIIGDASNSELHAKISNCFAESAGGGICVIGKAPKMSGRIEVCQTYGEGGGLALLDKALTDSAARAISDLYGDGLNISPVYQEWPTAGQRLEGESESNPLVFSGAYEEYPVEEDRAPTDGGGVYAYGDLYIGSHVSFEGCSNPQDGGAVYAPYGTVYLDGQNIKFDTNYIAFDIYDIPYAGNGGAIFADRVVFTSNAENVSFIDNYSVRGNGGDIYATYVEVEPGADDISFSGSISGYDGGAIYSEGDVLISAPVWFDGCGADSGAAICGFNVKLFDSVSVNNCTSATGAIYADDVSINGMVSFSGNQAQDTYGGAINATTVTIMSQKDVKFINNSAVFGGGAIYALDVYFALNGGNVLFENNTVTVEGGTNNGATGCGGAIYAHYNSDAAKGGSVSIAGSGDVEFKNNVSPIFGGAIYADTEVSLSNDGALTFQKNKAYNSGGDIYCADGQVMIGMPIDSNGEFKTGAPTRQFIGSDDVTYFSYMGGAIYAYGFSSNWATSFDGYGAESGAAVYAETMDISESLTVKNCNSADGAIQGGTITISGEALFENNEAGKDFGGAINATTVNLNPRNEYVIEFKNNTAKNAGGAIYATNVNIGADSGLETDSASVKFSGNRAENYDSDDYPGSGGAIYATRTVVCSTRASVEFTSNYAVNKGGAIYADSVELDGKVTFTSNTAENAGGAIYSEYVTLKATAKGEFTQNKAEGQYSDNGKGGAICAGSLYVNSAQVKFNSNTADGEMPSQWYVEKILEFYQVHFNLGFTTEDSSIAEVTLTENAYINFTGGSDSYVDINIYKENVTVINSSNASSTTGGHVIADHISLVQYGSTSIIPNPIKILNLESNWKLNYNTLVSDKAVVAVVIDDATITGGTYYYKNSTYTITPSGFNSEYMTITGNTAKEVGNYVATISLKEYCSWSSGSSLAKTASWSIIYPTVNLNIDSSLHQDVYPKYGTKNTYSGITSSSTKTLTKPTKDGYSFLGYFTSNSASGTKVIDENLNLVSGVSGYTDSNGNWALTKNATLYAQFVSSLNTIKFQFASWYGAPINSSDVKIISNDNGETQTLVRGSTIIFRREPSDSPITFNIMPTNSDYKYYIEIGKDTDGNGSNDYWYQYADNNSDGVNDYAKDDYDWTPNKNVVANLALIQQFTFDAESGIGIVEGSAQAKDNWSNTWYSNATRYAHFGAGITFRVAESNILDGYEFDGWYKGDTKVSSSMSYYIGKSGDVKDQSGAEGIRENLVLTAKAKLKPFGVTFDTNATEIQTNIFNYQDIISSSNATYDKTTGTLTGAIISGNTYNAVQFQKSAGTSYVGALTRYTSGNTYYTTFTVDSTFNAVRVKFNGSKADSGIHIGNLKYGETYTLSVDATEFIQNGNCVLKNFKLEFGDKFTGYTPAQKVVTAGSTYGTLPTITRDGYTFDGWKKNYFDGHEFLTYFNKYKKLQDQSTYISYANNIYSWKGAVGYITVSTLKNAGVPDELIRVPTDSKSELLYKPDLPYGTYIMSFTGRTEGLPAGGKSTALSPVYTNLNTTYYVTSSVWQDYSYQFVVDSTFRGFKLSYDNNNLSDFKNIQIEMIQPAQGEIAYVSSSTEISRTGAHSLIAGWTPKASFNANGGEINLANKDIVYGNTYGSLPTPTRDGYDFQGWYGANILNTSLWTPSNTWYLSRNVSARYIHEQDCIVLNGTASSAGNVAILSNFATQIVKGNTYYLRIEYVSGSMSGGANIYFGTNSSSSGYSSWDYNSINVSSSTPIATKEMVANNNYLTAMWINLTEGVVFNDYKIRVQISSENVDFYSPYIGTDKITSESKVQHAYNLNQTLIAKWELKDVNISLDANGGEVSPSSITRTYTTTYGNLPTPTRDGYTFKGWYGKNMFDVSKASTSYNVVNNGDGTLSVTPMASSSGVTANDILSTLAPGLEVGKTYMLSFTTTGQAKRIYLATSKSYWDVGTSRTITQNDLDSKVYWYANGTDTTFTATISNIQIELGSSATEYEPFISAAEITDETQVLNSEDHTLVAHWETNRYFVDFIANNLVKDYDFLYNESKGPYIKVSDFTVGNEYYWTVDVKSTHSHDAQIGFEGVSTYNKTINSTWQTVYGKFVATEAIHSFVVFNNFTVGETISIKNFSVQAVDETTLNYAIPSNIYEFGDKYGTLPTPTREGYTFVNWQNAAGETITADSEISIGNNHILYAEWAPKTYTVNYNADGGSVSPTSKTVTYGSTYGTLATPTNEGYTFLGWKKNQFDVVDFVNYYNYYYDMLVGTESERFVYENNILTLSPNRGRFETQALLNAGVSESLLTTPNTEKAHLLYKPDLPYGYYTMTYLARTLESGKVAGCIAAHYINNVGNIDIASGGYVDTTFWKEYSCTFLVDENFNGFILIYDSNARIEFKDIVLEQIVGGSGSAIEYVNANDKVNIADNHMLIANWAAGSVSYRVHHYYENFGANIDFSSISNIQLNENVTFITTTTHTAQTGETITAPVWEDFDADLYYDPTIVRDGVPYGLRTSGVILADNSTELYVFYKRMEFTITLEYTDEFYAKGLTSISGLAGNWDYPDFDNLNDYWNVGFNALGSIEFGYEPVFYIKPNANSSETENLGPLAMENYHYLAAFLSEGGDYGIYPDQTLEIICDIGIAKYLINYYSQSQEFLRTDMVSFFEAIKLENEYIDTNEDGEKEYYGQSTTVNFNDNGYAGDHFTMEVKAPFLGWQINEWSALASVAEIGPTEACGESIEDRFIPAGYYVKNLSPYIYSSVNLIMKFGNAELSITLPEPRTYEENYQFQFRGWYYDESFIGMPGETFILPTDANGNILDGININSRWSQNEFTVYFDGNGASSGSVDSQTFGVKDYISLPENTFERVHTVTFDAAGGVVNPTSTQVIYTFTGWNTKADGTGVSYSVGENFLALSDEDGSEGTLYAQWETDGVDLPEATRTGYTFDGWFYESESKNLIDIDAMVAGGALTDNGDGTYTFTGISVSQQVNILAGTTLIFSAEFVNADDLSTMDVILIHFYDDSNQQFGQVSINKLNTSVTSTISKNISKIKIGCLGIMSSPIVRNLQLVIEGNGELKQATDPFKPTSDVTLKAEWTAHQSTVVFDGNGATSGEMNSQTFVYGTAQNLTSNKFEKAHTVNFDANDGECSLTSTTVEYRFVGWNTKADGSGTSYLDRQSISNLTTENGATITLYAQWETDGVDLPEATREGYTFDGWFYESSGGNLIDIDAMVDGSALVDNGDGTYTLTRGVICQVNIPAGTTLTFSLEYVNADNVSDGQSALKFEFVNEFFEPVGTLSISKSHTAGTLTISQDANFVLLESAYDMDQVSLIIQNLQLIAEGSAELEQATDPFKPTSDVTLKAEWTANQYNVNFDAPNMVDGTLSDSWIEVTTTTEIVDNQEVYTYEILEITDPVEAGFENNFNVQIGNTYYWSIDVKMNLEESLTIGIDGADTHLKTINSTWQTISGSFVATSESNTFIVKGAGLKVGNILSIKNFSVQDASLAQAGHAIGTRIYEYDSKYENLPTPTREGHTFLGWAIGNSNVTANTDVKTAQDHTLTSLWEVNSSNLKLTFTIDGEEATAEQIANFGLAATIVVDETTYSNITSFDQAVDFGTTYQITSVAYNEKQFTINYNANVQTMPANGAEMLIAFTTIEYTVELFKGYYYVEHDVDVLFSTTSENLENIVVTNANPTGTFEHVYSASSITISMSLTNYSLANRDYYIWLYVFKGNEQQSFTSIKVAYGSGTTLTFDWTPNESYRLGWYVREHHNVEIASDAGIETMNVTIHSMSENNYTNGTYNDIINQAQLKSLTATLKAGYSFDGWYLIENGTTTKISSELEYIYSTPYLIKTDIKIEARTTANSYTVSFDSNGGEVSPASKQVTYLAPYGDLPTPTKTGYTFDGWYGKNLFNAKAIKASSIKVSEDGSTITLPIQTASNSNGYSGTSTKFSELCPGIKAGDTVIMHFNTTSAYNTHIYFSIPKQSWKINTPRVITQNDLDSNVVLYGNYVAKGETHQVVLTNFQIEFGETVTEYAQYFAGEEITKDTVMNLTRDHTLVAKWIANSYTVSFDANEGNVSPESKQVTFGKPYGELPTPTRTGYNFVGWYGPAGKNLIDPSKVQDKNLYVAMHTGELTQPTSLQSWRSSDFIQVNGGEKYAYTSSSGEAYSAGLAWFDENKTYISGLNMNDINSRNGILIAPSNAKYVRVSWRIDDGYNVDWQNTVQLEKGKIQTEFEHFYKSINSESIVEIAANHTLVAKWESKQVQVNIENVNSYATELADDCSTSGLYKVGDEIILHANVIMDNISWYCWMKDNAQYSTENPATYTITAEDAEAGIAISFKALTSYSWLHQASTEFSISADATGGFVSDKWQFDKADHENWTAVGYGQGYYISTSTTITEMYAKPNTGYYFYGWFLRVAPTAENYETICIARASECEYVESDVYGNYYSYKHDLRTVNPADGENGGGTFYALFLPIESVVTFDANEGTFVEGEETTKVVTFSKAYGTLPEVERTGYDFQGWFTQLSGGTLITEESIVNVYEDSILYARWSASDGTPYTVNHYLEKLDAEGTLTEENCDLILTDNLSGITGESVTPETHEYTGFTAPATQTVTIAADGSTIVNYFYSRNSHTLTLVAGTGVETVSGEGSYKFEQKISISATLKDGYIGLLWYQNTTVVDINTFTMPAENITLTAKASPISYTIVFDANGGTGEMSSMENCVFDTTFALTENAFSRVGFSFLGWSEDANAMYATYANKAEVSNLTTENGGVVTLYAIWSRNSYNLSVNVRIDGVDKSDSELSSLGISFNLLIGTTNHTGLTSYSDDIPFEETYKVTSVSYNSVQFSFVNEEDILNVETSMTIAGDSITIEFETNNYSIEINIGYHFVEHEVDYVLTASGCEDAIISSNNPTGSLVHAYSTDPTTVGIVLDSDQDLGRNYSLILEIKDLDGNKVDYFSVVVKDNETTPKITWNWIPSASYTATCIAREYMEVDVQTGEGISSSSVSYKAWENTSEIEYTNKNFEALHKGFLARLTASTKAGYEFEGWYITDNNGTRKLEVNADGTLVETYQITTDITLEAKTKVDTFTVNFDANGGIVSPTSQDVTYLAPYGELPTPTREGYTFKGWYLHETTLIIAETIVSETLDHTLVAHWEANEYSVKFDANTGSGEMETLTYTYDETYQLPANAFTKVGHSFRGWTVSVAGGEYGETETLGKTIASTGTIIPDLSFVKNLVASGEITFIAQWQTNNYPLELVFEVDGEVVDSAYLESVGVSATIKVGSTTSNNIREYSEEVAYGTTYQILSVTYNNKQFTAEFVSTEQSMAAETVQMIVKLTTRSYTLTIRNRSSYDASVHPTVLSITVSGGTFGNLDETPITTIELDYLETAHLKSYYSETAITFVITRLNENYSYFIQTPLDSNDDGTVDKYPGSDNIHTAYYWKPNDSIKAVEIAILEYFDVAVVSGTGIAENGAKLATCWSAWTNYKTTNSSIHQGSGLKYRVEQKDILEGYTFDGWYKDINQDGIFTEDERVSTDMEFVYCEKGNPGGAGLRENVTLTAVATLNNYKVSIASNNTEYGTVDVANVGADHGTELTVSGNTITINGTTITATPTEANAQYTYTFDGWYINGEKLENSYTIESDVAITAEFKASVNKYTISFVVDSNTPYGTIDVSSVVAEYGSVLNIDDKVITINDETITATINDNTQQYSYSFVGWFIDDVKVEEVHTVVGGTRVVAKFDVEVNKYTWTFKTKETTPYGTVSPSSVTIEYGTSVSISGNKLTIGTNEVVATANASSGGYNFSFYNWFNLTATIVDDRTIEAIFERTEIVYSITYKDVEGATNNNPTTYTVESEDITLVDPILNGFTFAGWIGEGYTNPTKEITISQGSTGNKQFTAVWLTDIEISLKNSREDNKITVEVYNEDESKYGTFSENFQVVRGKAYKFKVTSILVADENTNDYQILRVRWNNSIKQTYHSLLGDMSETTIVEKEVITATNKIVFEYINAYRLNFAVPTNTIVGLTIDEIDELDKIIIKHSSNYIIAEGTPVVFAVNSTPVSSAESKFTFIGFNYVVNGETLNAGVSGGADIEFLKFTHNSQYINDSDIGTYLYNIKTGVEVSQITLQTIASQVISIDTSEIITGNFTLTSEYGFNKVITSETTSVILYKGTWTVSHSDLSLAQIKKVFSNYKVSEDQNGVITIIVQ